MKLVNVRDFWRFFLTTLFFYAGSATAGLNLLNIHFLIFCVLIGGTYMTLLTTITNIGSGWPQTLFLYMVDIFSIKNCTYDSNGKATIVDTFSSLLDKIDKNVCNTDAEMKQCTHLGGKCVVFLDAYYLIAVGCGIFGILWIWSNRSHIWFLQSLPKNTWKIRIKR